MIQEFLNSVNLEGDEDDLSGPASLEAWFIGHGLMEPGAPLTAVDHRNAIALREALRAWLRDRGHGAGGRQALSTLNTLAAASDLKIDFSTSAIALEPRQRGFWGAIGLLLITAFEQAQTPRWQRLKICERDECQWAFYDRSNNRSSRWCTMAICGSRVKASTHRQRQSRN